jgi:hypothetical protein
MRKVSDAELLKRLLEVEDLDDPARKAFEDMAQLVDRTGHPLSHRQRDWLESVARKLDVEFEEPNLVSTGVVKVTEKERMDLQRFLDGLPGGRPLRPPGRQP